MRSTRGFYKKKTFLFGLFMFISIALISTGFAAWVISSNVKSEQNGNVNVGVVAETKLTIEQVNLTNNKFAFEPASDDTTGRVRHDGKNFESLETTLTAVIKPVDFLGNVKVEFVLPDGVKAAITAGYITYKTTTITEAAASASGYNYQLTEEEKKAQQYDLNQVLGFEWGTRFGNMNPGKYYDEDPGGLNVSDADLKKELEDFRATIFGYKAELDKADGQAARDKVIESHKDATLQFTIRITASVN